jgi:hypothetical protein
VSNPQIRWSRRGAHRGLQVHATVGDGRIGTTITRPLSGSANPPTAPSTLPGTLSIVDAALIKKLSDIGELLVPLNGRGRAGQAGCRAFLERIERMWIVMAQAKPSQFTDQMLHRGCRAKAGATWRCCLSARA